MTDTRPLESRLPQLLRMVQLAAQGAPCAHHGHLFLLGNSFRHPNLVPRIWITQPNMTSGWIAADNSSREDEIVQGFGRPLLRLMQSLLPLWPREATLSLSPDQAVLVGRLGMHLVRTPTALHADEPHWFPHIQRFRQASLLMAPGEVAIAGSLHHRLAAVEPACRWSNRPWSLSGVPLPLRQGAPDPLLLFRFPDQAVLCREGDEHPELVQAWRL